ncbi:MAG: Cadmium, zinc and cobalt-transporting ATPase [Firmicutes bacterium ADurb.Bin146]|mgnify:CR=1 FL=1|nr:MAG: Cadmium, zinc and cobalt-transporting ATPase [Firmicutes bacterium ADurb.Bin146]
MIRLNKKQKITIFRITISSVLLVTALLLSDEIARIIFYIASYLVIGYEVLLKSFRNILHGDVFDENFLMSIATIGAFAIKEYPEAVAVMLFYETGEFFQEYAVEKSRKSITDLMDIRPDHANVVSEDGITLVNPEKVKVGDIILVKPGERVPLDGIVIEGESALDMSSLTGESLPVDIKLSDTVLSGSINIYGMFKLQVEKPYEESTVAKILELVENTSSKKAKTERIITRFSRFYTPIVVISAVILAVVPPLVLGYSWKDWIYRALVFLVVSCPCALVLSVPLSFFSALGAASKNGILVKGGSYLEALAKTKAVIFDKTGTLTKGIFKVTAIHPERLSSYELLEIAAAAESYSDHPISKSLQQEYMEQIEKSRISEIREIAGHGIKAVIDGRRVSVGNEKLMEMDSVKWNHCDLEGTIVHVAVEDEYMGHIIISDEIKKDASKSVKELEKIGITDISMLTGDSKSAAYHIASQAGIKKVAYSLLPHEKTDYVLKKLDSMKDKEKLVFVGDGINDAPVLAGADIGVSMGLLGSQSAIEASDAVIMDDLPSKVPLLIRLSKKTMRIAKQNMAFAISVKLIVLIAGAAGLASLWSAVFADVGVSLIAVLNAIRLLRKNI